MRGISSVTLFLKTILLLFSKEENLRNHKLAQHTKFECHLCDYKTHTGESLDSHFDNEHFVPKFKCSECDAIFHTERTLKEHSRKHNKYIVTIVALRQLIYQH